MAIWNILKYPLIEIINPDLLQEFFQPDKVHIYEKVPKIIDHFRRAIGEGVVFSEGTKWKKKRKIMNAVFNYEFIISIIPQIVAIHNQCFEAM